MGRECSKFSEEDGKETDQALYEMRKYMVQSVENTTYVKQRTVKKP